ncbi:MAG: hypothetical protein SV201_08430, partial [Pseudomonadota bacterium]|nr:hypothetical protein [Pseudomonadota bacterium]
HPAGGLAGLPGRLTRSDFLISLGINAEVAETQRTRRKTFIANKQVLIVSPCLICSTFRAKIKEIDNRYLRVVLLPDGETVHNAFFDRAYLNES